MSFISRLSIWMTKQVDALQQVLTPLITEKSKDLKPLTQDVFEMVATPSDVSFKVLNTKIEHAPILSEQDKRVLLSLENKHERTLEKPKLTEEEEKALQTCIGSLSLNRLTSSHIHLGLQNTIQITSIHRLDASQIKALHRYCEPSFPYAKPTEKLSVLGALSTLWSPTDYEKILMYHLPPRATSTTKAVTFAHDSEMRFENCPQVTEFFALDERGSLPMIVYQKDFLEKLVQVRINSSFTASIHAAATLQKGGSWVQLTPMERMEVLSVLHDMKQSVALVRWKTSPRAHEMPASMRDELQWERNQPLLVAEVKTKTSLPSNDQLMADIRFVEDKLAPNGSKGHHGHIVTELADAEAVNTVGMSMVKLAFLSDVLVMSENAADDCDIFAHSFLEGYKASDLDDAQYAMLGDKIDIDALYAQKLHRVGLRDGNVYKNPHALGIEFRGVRGAQNLSKHISRATQGLQKGTITKLQNVDVSGWNAGNKKDVDVNYMQSKATFTKEEIGTAGVEYSYIYDYAMDYKKPKEAHKSKTDWYMMSAPLWNYESLPCFTENQKEVIAEARKHYEKSLMTISSQIQNGMEDKGPMPSSEDVYKTLLVISQMFFEQAGIHKSLDAYLENTLSR